MSSFLGTTDLIREFKTLIRHESEPSFSINKVPRILNLFIHGSKCRRIIGANTLTNNGFIKPKLGTSARLLRLFIVARKLLETDDVSLQD